MKYRIKPEQVHVVVFLFFVLAAGCKGIGEYAWERLESQSAAVQQVEQAVEEPAHICAAAFENCSNVENLDG